MDAHVLIPAARELEPRTCQALADQLAVVDPTADLVVDLTDVTFCDTSGIGVLVAAWRRHREAGGSLQVVHLAPNVAHVFQAMGIAPILQPV